MAVTVTVYDNAIENFFLGDMGALDVDSCKLGLVSSSYSISEANDNAWGDAGISSNEIAAGNGYVAGGQALANPAVSLAAGTVKFDADDVSWTASGGSIPAHRRAVLYNDTPTTPTADPLMLSVLGDDSPADIPATLNGETLTYQWHTNGILTAT